MKRTESIVMRQVQDWNLVGPLAIFAALLIALTKADSSQLIILLLSAVIGTALCWMWQLRGLIVASVLMTGLIIYRSSTFSYEDPLWHIGIMASLGLSFLIISLASSEVNALVNHIESDLTTTKASLDAERQQQLLQRSEIEKVALEHTAQLQKHQAQLTQAQQALAHSHTELQMTQDLLAGVRKDLEHSQIEQSQRSKELSSTKQHLQEAQREVSALLPFKRTCEELQSTLQTLTEINKQKAQELATLSPKVQQFMEEVQHLKKQHESCLQDLKTEQERNAAHQKLVETAENELRLQVAAFNQLDEHLGKLVREKEELAATIEGLKQERQAVIVQEVPNELNLETERALRRSEAMYKQLRQQFNEKSDLLDKTRKELFLTEEECSRQQIMRHEECIYKRSREIREFERHIIRMEQEYTHLKEDYEREIDTLHEIIALEMQR